MKKGIVLAAALIVFASGGIGWAAEGDLGVDVDVTWVSKYIWRGFDMLDDKAALQPSVSVDIFDSGFSVTAWASYAGSSKGAGDVSTVNGTEWNYILTYSNSAFEGEIYQMDYAANYIYYDFIDGASKTADTQEINVSVAFPQLCGFGVVPNYTAIYMWPARSGGISNSMGGWIHQFGLDYDLTLGEILPNNPEQILTFSWDITYNDGAGGRSTNPVVPPSDVDHDWSHMTWGVSTEITCPLGGKLRPGVYYQTSMDDSVNDEDEFWTGVSYTISF